MSRYTVIADIGNALVRLLRERMSPEPIVNPASIDICLPYDRGDIVLGLYLYDVREDESIRFTNKTNLDAGKQKYPPVILSLYYMLTAYSASDVKSRAADDHKILGRAIQVFHDNAALKLKSIRMEDDSLIQAIKIEMVNNDIEEKSKIWSFPGLPYRLSVCYKVFPVEIESMKTKQVRRVVDIEMQMKE